jgi:hypothetical protein
MSSVGFFFLRDKMADITIKEESVDSTSLIQTHKVLAPHKASGLILVVSHKGCNTLLQGM